MVAVDIADDKLELARSVGAVATVNATVSKDVIEIVQSITRGGEHVSIDALGRPTTCFNSVANLRKRGKHVQVGLMLADHSHSPVPMDKVIANELEILGSHGIQAYKYPALLEMIKSGKLHPEILIGKTISLEESIEALTSMSEFNSQGVTVITEF